jgi:hypothetical protein
MANNLDCPFALISHCAALGELNLSHPPELVAHPEIVVNGTKDPTADPKTNSEV